MLLTIAKLSGKRRHLFRVSELTNGSHLTSALPAFAPTATSLALRQSYPAGAGNVNRSRA